MQRGTALAIALANAAAGKKGLGIEHCINNRVNETTKGVITEPDVYVNSTRYTGALRNIGKPVTAKHQSAPQAPAPQQPTTDAQVETQNQ